VGNNSFGNLGSGPTTTRSAAVVIEASGVTAISAGDAHSLFLKSDGSLWGMGNNTSGQLGMGTTVSSFSSPVKIVDTGVTAMAAGSSHSLFLESDGSLRAMGDNSNGELGDGTTVSQLSPKLIVPSGIAAIAAGNSFSLVLASSGELVGAGINSFGNLGAGPTSTAVGGIKIQAGGVSAIAAGDVFSLFLTGDSGLWAMGYNNAGELGDGTFTSRIIPEQTLAGIPSVQPVIVIPPSTEAAVVGSTASYSVSAVGFPVPTYQWQVSTDGGKTWADASGSAYSGSTSATLTVNAPTAGELGYQYQAIATSAGKSSTSVPASLVVGTSTAKLTWLQENFSTVQLGTPALVGDLATPANDGIPNLIKYAFNLRAQRNGQGSLPQPTLVNGKPGFIFQAPQTDVTYTVQASTDLVSWSAAGVTTVINGSQVTASYSPTGNTPVFMRILIAPVP